MDGFGIPRTRLLTDFVESTADEVLALAPDDGFFPSFSRGFQLEYRSVVDGPAPTGEDVGRVVRNSADIFFETLAIVLTGGRAPTSASTALLLPRSIGAAANITTTSRIGASPYARRLADALGEAAQKDVDALLVQLRAGNSNPGIGTRALGNGFFELRGRNAGRVIVKQVSAGEFDIVGKFQGHVRGDAANGKIIERLKSDYLKLGF